jgi:phospholipid/cholesterol/gamma-HCH transport system substrate-binding protein
VTDTSVVVRLLIQKDVQKFIKSDAIASIGSDGLMGDKVLTISPGTNSKTIVKDNASIQSVQAIEMDEIMIRSKYG